MSTVLIKGATIVTGDDAKRIDVLVEDGVIQEIKSDIQDSEAKVIDATGKLLFPGFIDCHVHFREPGLTHKATMQTESEAALAGGVTTVCEMPNTISPTVTVDAFRAKVKIAEAQKIDIRLFFGITEKAHIAELRALVRDPKLKQRLAGVKLYLDHSTGDQKVDGGIVDEIFQTCAELDVTLVAHCEDAEMNASANAAESSKDISSHSLRRPAESEVKSVDFALALAKKHKTRFHVAHLSTAGALDLVRQAKRDGLAVTCEVTPHHLFLSTDDYKTLGTLAKMNPPLRSPDHVKALWQGIQDGTVDCVSTDHAPHTLAEKTRHQGTSFANDVPSGVPGVETMIPLLLTAIAEKKMTVNDLYRLCFVNPNHIFGLGKQELVVGATITLVLVDPTEKWTIEAKKLHAKCGWTPFEGQKVQGKVIEVIR